MRKMSASTSGWCSRCLAPYLVTNTGSERLMKSLSSDSPQLAASTALILNCVPACENCQTPPPSSSPAAG
jgi:hypothetical protein